MMRCGGQDAARAGAEGVPAGADDDTAVVFTASGPVSLQAGGFDRLRLVGLARADPEPPRLCRRLSAPFHGPAFRQRLPKRLRGGCRRLQPTRLLLEGEQGLQPGRGRGGAPVGIEAAVVGDYPSDAERSGRAMAQWLAAQADEHDVQPDPDLTLQRLIIEFGRVAGAEINTAAGPLLVRALDGVALPTTFADADWPVRPDLGGIDLEVVIVGRPAGRFGRVELLQSA